MSLLQEFWHNFSHNLFKPLLLFFYLGFSIPLLKVSFEFPYVIYQGLTMYLLLAIGWHGGEELASLSFASLQQAVGFMVIGFFTNFVIGCIAYYILRGFTRLRRIDAATVAGYYGSDSAGTFVTCVGVLSATGIVYAAYMPVMLAVMEIPGCLVALYLVSRLRHKGMDVNGNAWDEPGYDPNAVLEEQLAVAHASNGHSTSHSQHGHATSSHGRKGAAHVGSHSQSSGYQDGGGTAVSEMDPPEHGDDGYESHNERDKANGEHKKSEKRAVVREAEMALEKIEGKKVEAGRHQESMFNKELAHEVFMNPGIYLLFGGILIGFVSRLQGAKVTARDDALFVTLFEGILCLFLLEMGITASKRLRDLRAAGLPFILFGILAPNVFATIGILVAHAYSAVLGMPFDLGTYVLFGVLCGASSYIAVPAVQRLAIPEASPTLPLAASLGLTFSYNVTIGIPVYIMIAKVVMSTFPIA
jgi:hypothetical protein